MRRHALHTKRQTLYQSVADSTAIASSASEDTFQIGGVNMTIAIPANRLRRVGQWGRIAIAGSLGATGTPTVRVRLRDGSTILYDSTAVLQGAGAGQAWAIEIEFSVRATGAGGSIMFAPFAQRVGNNRNGNGVPGAISLDLSAPRNWTVTAQWSAASASNTITISHANARMEGLRA